MRVLIIFFLAALFSWNHTYAQDIEFRINYPEESVFECPPVCIEFDIITDSFYTYENIVVAVDPAWSSTVTNQPNGIYEVCMNFAGTYIITASAVATGPNGVIDSVQHSIYVFIEEGNWLQGDILGPSCGNDSTGTDCLETCEYATHTYFFNGSSQEIVWDVIGAESFSTNGNSVEVTWGEAGTGTLMVFDLLGQCDARIERCVEILPTPTAEFETSPEANNGVLQVCRGEIIYFTNLSMNASSYEWTFGDGTTSDLFEPSHAYQTPGTYTVSLLAANHCDGCMSTYEIEVEVLPAAAPELSCLATVCPGERARYDAITDGCQTFHWSVSNNGTILSGGGTEDDYIEIEWDASSPDGIIELLVENCNSPYCDDPAIFRIPIISPNGPVEGDERVCAGEITTYTAPYFPGVVYNWTVTNRGTILSGQNTNAVSIKWDDVSFVVDNERVEVNYDHCYLGCQGTDFMLVKIVPHLSIQANATYCYESDGAFTSTTGFFGQNPVSSNWTLFDENRTELWNSPSADATINIPMNYPPGKYFMRATPDDPSGVCEDYIEHEFLITALPPSPLAINADSFICVNVPYGFSVDPAGPYGTSWTITDGTTITNYSGNAISHTFTSNGPYIVEASHVDLIYGCLSAAISKELFGSWTATIYGPDEICEQEYSAFNVFDLPGSMIEWRVEPADMAEIKNKNSTTPEIFWTGDGNAQVILSTCNQDIVHNIIVHPLPEPTVTPPAGLCENETALISTDLSYVSYVWRNEDNDIISEDPSVNLGPGYYSVDVTDVNGCQNSETFHIPFFPSPIARISTGANTGYCGTVPPTLLTANTDIGYSYQWYHDNVPVGTDSEFYTADQFGSYHVVITNSFGCTETSNRILFFEYCGPTSGGVCNGQTCNAYPCLELGNLGYNIDAPSCESREYTSVSLPGFPIMPGSQIWDIENADGSYTRYLGDPAVHTYGAPGIYTIVLLAKVQGFPYSDDDCYHLFAFKDTVEAVSDFRFTEGCVGASTEFFDISTYLPDVNVNMWSWEFGDGNTSNDENPTNNYAAAGTYNVTLTITTDAGCNSVKTYPVNVHAPPTLAIDAVTEACENNPVAFTVNSPEALFDIQWNFDDASSPNNSATRANVSHTYETSGIYNPEVSAANVFGCVADASQQVEIFQNNLAGDITSTNGTEICEGETTDLISPPGGVLWDWNTDETTEQITTGIAGNYEVILEDDKGCVYAPDPIFIEVNPKPVVTINGREIINEEPGYWQDTVETCEGVDIELKAFTSSQTTYLWSTSATTESILFTKANGNLLTPGTHVISVTVRDIVTNCESDPAEIVVIVHDNPDDFTISLNSGSGCSDGTNILQIDNPQTGVIYTWSDGQVGTQITAENAGIYRAFAMNMYGCETSSTNVVEIRAAPRVDLFPTGCFVRCNPDTICIPPIPNVSYYELLRNDTVINSGLYVPDELVVTQSGDYTIYIEGDNGCTSTSDVLSLDLYPGYGDIEVTVYVDVNGNGVIDGPDTTISGVNVHLIDGASIYDTKPSNTDGIVYYLNAPEATYIGSIDTMGLPPGLSPIINNIDLEVIGCDVFVSGELLLGACVTNTPVSATLCPGEALILGDTVVYPTADFVYYDRGVGGECDTIFDVTITPSQLGVVKIIVFNDVDSNYAISAGDTMAHNIDVIITDLSDNSTTNNNTGTSGMIWHQDTVGIHRGELDLTLLDPALEPILMVVNYTINPCDTTEIQLLVGPSCYPVSVDSTIELCMGDSVLIDGNYYFDETMVQVVYPIGACDSTVKYSIELKNPMTLTVTTNDACDGEDNGSISITPSGGNGTPVITWAHSASDQFSLTDLAPATYSYSIDDGQCPVNGEVVVGEYIFPAIDLIETDPSCPNSTDGSIVVSLASQELQWSLDSVNYTTEDFVDLNAGTYTIHFTNGNCFQSQIVELEEKVVEPFEIQQVWELPVNVPVELTHNYLDSLTHEFWWSASQFLDCDNCPLPTFTGADELIDIQVTVTDPDGCVQEANLQMRVDLSPHIYIPNAFSPNGDQVNDRIKPYVREGVVRTDKFEIFDRWGNKVYSEEFNESIGDIEGWDGSRHGSLHAPGLFIYMAEFSYINGTKVTKHGEVHLIR